MKKIKIDKMLAYTMNAFKKIVDKRASNITFSLADILQSALAIFVLKDSSMLKFMEALPARKENLLRIFKISNCPSDTQMRTVLDKVCPWEIQAVKRKLVLQIDRDGVLKDYRYIQGGLIVAVDGVNYFNSKEIHCSRCQTKKHRDGSVSYSHSMLSAVVVHPNKKAVIPLRDEPIVGQDGQRKNDSELCAVCRLLDGIKEDYPKLKPVIVADALYANGPNILNLRSKKYEFIIRAKKGSGAGYTFEQYRNLLQQDKVSIKESRGGKVWKIWHYVNDLHLNGANKDIKVNFIHYEERDPRTGKLKNSFDWITSFRLTEWNVEKIVKAGRARWNIENQTFNTLKNQGYEFEHNYGHGEENLCTVLAFLMMMAFLMDQIQQIYEGPFTQAWEEVGAKIWLWERIRAYFGCMSFNSMELIYKAIIHRIKGQGFVVVKQDGG